MKQVIYMENRIADDPKQGRRKLEQDPIKVVAGVGGQLFIIDHHHAAEAWLGATTEWGANALCKIVNSEKGLPAEFKTEDEFWSALKAASLIRLKNESGIDIDPSQLPKTLEAMADDPYLPSDPNDKNPTVDEAVEMAHSSEAENLPGYCAVTCQ
jgi:hypothetical protein